MAENALKAIVERYISQPGDRGFAVLSVSLPGGTRTRICGNGLAGLAAGQTIEVTGSWTTHQKWGRQFRAKGMKILTTADEAGLRRWLTETGMPGVGGPAADKLVDELGMEAIQLIVTGDQRARDILGARFDDARTHLEMHQSEIAIGPRMAANDIGPELRDRIFRTYGIQTAERISRDPYRLVDDVEGMTFAVVDRFAKATGMGLVSRSRLVAAALDALRTAANDGHTAVDSETLARMVTARTGVEGDLIEALVADMDHPQTVATTILRRDGEVVDGWALAEMDALEQTIAGNVLDKLEQPSLILECDARRYVAAAEAALKVELNKEQREGAVMALSESFSILTGGPGTGKTTTLKCITTAWSMAAAEGWVRGDIKLGAPTGKAAMRMKESTEIDSTTVHRLLEVDPETRGFVRNEALPIEAGYIAIDESSMKDVPLAAALTRAWGDANVLLIGDPDQLASVGPGRVLGDLIESGVVPVTHLVQVRRQAEGSAIAEGAKAIREGRMPVMEAGSDFMFIECDDVDAVGGIVSELHAAFVEDGMDVQALTPGHQGSTGTIALNERLQSAANLQGMEIAISGGRTARVGDKVIQMINDNDLEVFNGDAGRMSAVTADAAKVTLGGREVEMSNEALTRLSLAYALTVHKSQGSEYQVVLMPVTTAHRMMLKRTLIYTGLTRAKQMCIVVGSRKAFEQAIANDDGRSRVTTLAQRLRIMSGRL